MKLLLMVFPVIATLTLVGCASSPPVQRLVLSCEDEYEGGYIGLYSFNHDKLTPPIDPKKVDLVLYFDSNDCSQGALIGNDDRSGYLYPIGYKTWDDLNSLRYPKEDEAPVAAIAPLSKEKEGLMFWVKTHSRGFVLARIETVNPASFSDVAAGGKGEIVVEWMDIRKNSSP